MITQDLTMSTMKAQLYGAYAFCLGAPVMVWPYYLIWGFHKPSHSLLLASVVSGVVMIVGILAHELIHGLTAVWYGRVRWRDTKFGMQWKSLTPYFHSTVPLKARTYRVVVLMPLIILGAIPYLVALMGGSLWLLVFSVFFTLAAAGDLMILWLMYSLSPDELVQDHPTKVGLLVVKPLS